MHAPTFSIEQRFKDNITDLGSSGRTGIFMSTQASFSRYVSEQIIENYCEQDTVLDIRDTMVEKDLGPEI